MKSNKSKIKIISIASIILVIGLSVFVYVRYFYVFGEGIKAGNLNYLVYKGYVFKTYEGMVIQTGFKSKTQGAIESNEFKFSVVNDSVARQLMLNSGNNVQLHYKEYFAPIFWRGKSKYVVDKIENIYSRDRENSIENIDDINYYRQDNRQYEDYSDDEYENDIYELDVEEVLESE